MLTSASYNEPEILKELAEGSESAFRKLFHSWQPFLASHIYRITESAEITEEIVQDVFLKIWQARETLGEIQHFKAYLLVVSKNHALNTLRKIARDFTRQQEYIQTRSVSEEPESSEAYFSLIDEAIEKLSPRQKEIFVLSRHHKKSYGQIALELGIGKESVKTHLGLAVKRITRHVKTRLAGLFFLFML
jgi:RNA polymerase sigma-70 factor (ECF subfamily)